MSELVKHSHNYLSDQHSSNEVRTWCVISLCFAAMIIEITCGVLFGSLALIADGIHMSTHAIAFFITASAYSYARKHADNPIYVFGTGKVGDLAAYTSAIILLGISLYIIYDGIYRFVYPEKLEYLKALPVAFVGLSINIASGLILSLSCKSKKNADNEEDFGVTMGHGHGHGHSHGHQSERYDYDSDDEVDNLIDHIEHADHDETFHIPTSHGTIVLSIFEDGIPPVFRISYENWQSTYPKPIEIILTTTRSKHSTQMFTFDCLTRGDLSVLQSVENVPEPHEFHVKMTVLYSSTQEYSDYFVEFKESDGHEHGHGHGNNYGYGEVVRSDFNPIQCDCGIPGHHDHSHDEKFHIETNNGIIILSIFEDGIPPVFRISYENWITAYPMLSDIIVTTTRSDQSIQSFHFACLKPNDLSTLQSIQNIPEPHEFNVKLSLNNQDYVVEFIEHDGHDHGHGHEHENATLDVSHGHGHDHDSHGHEHEHENSHEHGHDHEEDCHEHGHEHENFGNGHENYHQVALDVRPFHESKSSKQRKKLKYQQDNNFRAAIIHVVADAFVSVLVIVAISIAGNVPHTNFLDPLVGVIGAFVIINWAYTLGFDTAANLLDMNPDMELTNKIESVLQRDGSKVNDLHVWRLGPGHLGAVISILPPQNSSNYNRQYYLNKLKRFKALSHTTIEVINL